VVKVFVHGHTALRLELEYLQIRFLLLFHNEIPKKLAQKSNAPNLRWWGSRDSSVGIAMGYVLDD
jgi:hypothetical protein